MSAQIIQLPRVEARQPAKAQRKTRAERDAAREATRRRELQERLAELSPTLGLDSTFRSWHMCLDQLSVQMDLPYIHINDAKEMFSRMFKNGAMYLRY